MIYRVATLDDLNEIIIMKNKVKQRIINQNLPMWLNGYPLDEYIIDDIKSNEGRVIEINGKIVSYSCFHHASKEYGNGVFKKDNVMSFGRLMVDDGYVGKHIGDYMVKSMIEEAKSLNVEGVGILADDFNVKAMNLYKKYGFNIEGARQFPYAYLTILGLYF
ncbi:MAG: GNAT family N-acetyltransferase [Bacilli bacterium]|nr:GNAT family N-acetyltransferase [Bacilli bacterium]